MNANIDFNSADVPSLFRSDPDHFSSLDLILISTSVPEVGVPQHYEGETIKNIFTLAIFGAVFCTSVLGNVLVGLTIIVSRRLHTLTNALLFNLCVSDLLIGSHFIRLLLYYSIRAYINILVLSYLSLANALLHFGIYLIFYKNFIQFVICSRTMHSFENDLHCQ